ncbi:hypothetical protein M8542_18795 [Amycolatopsis sp. OK19-0408]|uniref:Uncharacterized protein n=1 Tax=Amycolatopsis iheyensis TaxID=2945988 RepID=A0A9X2NCR9_9PSEU|nr:hypothetical protein [Amycolatopsis iheyensis]MCR6484881.1 hypothetical protein [Amycolatopsis iheyensis]
MTFETISRVPVGFPVERVLPHPRLPLLACFDAGRPAVHVLDREGGRLAAVGADLAEYAPAAPWTWHRRQPAAAWHPDEPLLVVANEAEARRWTPAGLSTVDKPAGAAYRSLAFGPDGALWASPSARYEFPAWERADVVDPASGAVGSAPLWDTGVATHPAGGLVATLRSNQGASLVLFAEPGGTLRDRALILDADGYETPVFSADGRRFAIRGNAYENSLEVFEFPSLRRILATTLGRPYPGYDEVDDEWLAESRSWSDHNIAYEARLWIGTPAGTLVEVDVDGEEAVEHELAGGPVTALAAGAPGELVAAAGAELVFLTVPTGEPDAAPVAEFLAATAEAPAGETEFRRFDGTREWDTDDLAEVMTAEPADLTWLQLQAAMNTARRDRGV